MKRKALGPPVPSKPQISQDYQRVFWKLADSLAKVLRTPSGASPADPQWSVTGITSRAWKVDHPDLPVVKDDTGAMREVLLQLHVQKEGDGYWYVVAQNKVQGPDNQASPKALIVTKEDTEPGTTWDIENIAKAAANFFKQQKEDLANQAQKSAPVTPPGQGGAPPADGAGAPGGGMDMSMPGGGMDMAGPPMGGGMPTARLRRLANEIQNSQPEREPFRFKPKPPPRKYKYTTVRQYGGDDGYQWAVFIKGQGRPAVTGLTKPEIPYHRNRIEDLVHEKYNPKQ